MLKGVNRNVLVVRTDKSSKFEAVYFVLRRGNTSERSDIVREANKIIKQGEGAGALSRRLGSAKLCFAAGTVGGSLFIALVWLLSALLG